MLQLVGNEYAAFKCLILNDEQKLFYLFTNEDNDVCRGISKFTVFFFKGFKQREKIVKLGSNDKEVIGLFYSKLL